MSTEKKKNRMRSKFNDFKLLEIFPSRKKSTMTDALFMLSILIPFITIKLHFCFLFSLNPLQNQLSNLVQNTSVRMDKYK